MLGSRQDATAARPLGSARARRFPIPLGNTAIGAEHSEALNGVADPKFARKARQHQGPPYTSQRSAIRGIQKKNATLGCSRATFFWIPVGDDFIAATAALGRWQERSDCIWPRYQLAAIVGN